jgi:hypothetical protein
MRFAEEWRMMLEGTPNLGFLPRDGEVLLLKRKDKDNYCSWN